jgi:hypothetical protein
MSTRIYHIGGLATGFQDAISRSPTWQDTLLSAGYVTDLVGSQAPSVTEVTAGSYILWWINDDDVAVSASITGGGTQYAAVTSTSGLRYILFLDCDDDDVIETSGTGPVLHLTNISDSIPYIIRMDKREQSLPNMPYIFIGVPKITRSLVAMNAWDIKATTDIFIKSDSIWNDPTVNDNSDLDFDLLGNLSEALFDDINDQYPIGLINFQPVNSIIEVFRINEPKVPGVEDGTDYLVSQITIETEGGN